MVKLTWPNDSWRPLDQAEFGTVGYDALCARTGLGGDYTPVMTVRTVVLPSGSTMSELGDQAAQIFATQTGGAERVQRSETTGDPKAPALVQKLKGVLQAEGKQFDLRHIDALIGTRQPDGSVIVIALGLTCTVDQLPVVAPEFGSVYTGIGPSSSDH